MNCTAISFKKCIPIFFEYFFYFVSKVPIIAPPRRNVNFPIWLNCDSTPVFSSLSENSQAVFPSHLTHPMYKRLPDCLCEAAVAPRQLCISPYSVHQELNSVCFFVQTWDTAHLGLPGTCSPIMEGQLTKAVHQIIVINRDVGLVFILSRKCGLKSADKHSRVK